MIYGFLSAFRNRLTIKYRVIFVLPLLCVMAAARPSEAANLTIEQPVLTPTAVQIGQQFVFSVNLYSSIAISNAIVKLDVKDKSGNLLLQQVFSGQNFQPGQTIPYSWTATIPSGKSISVPFTVGSLYNVVVYVFNSNYSGQYTPSVVADTFGVTSVPNVGYTSTAPITPPVGTGKTYYVSDPSNAAVNQANLALLPPGATVFTTLQAASNVTNPGDTVLVMNGTYQLLPTKSAIGVVYITRSGSAAGGYITYAAYPGAKPIISTSLSNGAYDAIAITASYIVIQGFEVIGDAQNITLSYASDASQAEFSLLAQEIAAGQPETYPGSIAKTTTNGNCIGISGVTHIIIVNNLVHDCSAAGIDAESSDYITFEANTVYNTSWWTLYDTSGIAMHRSLNSDSSTAYKNYVIDNISYNSANTQPFISNVILNDENPGSALSTPTDGNGIIIDSNQHTNDGSPYLGRTLVAGNITYDNGASGIHAYGSSHVDMINNTTFLNDICQIAGSYCGPGPRAFNGGTITGINNGQLYSLNGNDINIFNNILYAPAGKFIQTDYTNTNYAEGYNIIYSADGQGLVSGFTPDPTDILADPLFMSDTNPALYNFEFAPNSPGINAGILFSTDGVSVPTLINLPIVNGTVDIGAAQ